MLLDNSKLNNFSQNSIWSLVLISSWWHSYDFFDIWDLIDTCSLSLCCSNDSQKCEWQIMNTEETERKKSQEKTSIWKPDIGLLNFLRNTAFTIIATI